MTGFDEARSRLEARLGELRERLAKIQSDVRHAEGLEDDWTEQAQQLENDEVLGALDQAGRQELRQIELALARMDSGDYGMCRDCGETIAAARLKALPFAERCIDCAERAAG